MLAVTQEERPSNVLYRPRPQCASAVSALSLSLCLAALLLGAAAPVHAAPLDDTRTDTRIDAPADQGAANDPVTQLLLERGLLPARGAEMVEAVRHRASEMVLAAMNFLGVPYVRGGNTAESGFDCSGFTRYVFEHSLGLVLPRRADEQAASPALQRVGREELRPGDLVFFNTLRRTFSHVGIYVGEGKFIHAPRTGSNVRIDDMGNAYWSQRFTGARRADTPIAATGFSTRAQP